MWTNKDTDASKKAIRDYHRGMLRSKVISVVWSAFQAKKERDGFTMSDLASTLGLNKSQISRWFNGDPNWTVNTIADIADALDADIRLEICDRQSGEVFNETGKKLASFEEGGLGFSAVIYYSGKWAVDNDNKTIQAASAPKISSYDYVEA